jgi:hypothetical protein
MKKTLFAICFLFVSSAFAQFGPVFPPQGPDFGPYPTNPGVVQPPPYGEYVVRRQILCESNSGRTANCSAGLREVSAGYLVQQRSRTACIEGSSFRFFGDRVEVSGGCRGVFEFVGVTNQPGPQDMVEGEVVRETFVCESVRQRTRTCRPMSMRRAVDIQYDSQLSRAPCIEGQSYFIQNGTVTVSNGCRAQFSAKGVR